MYLSIDLRQEEVRRHLATVNWANRHLNQNFAFRDLDEDTIEAVEKFKRTATDLMHVILVEMFPILAQFEYEVKDHPLRVELGEPRRRVVEDAAGRLHPARPDVRAGSAPVLPSVMGIKAPADTFIR
jgi:hypothetical protein